MTTAVDTGSFNIGNDALLWLAIAIIGFFLRDLHQTVKEKMKAIKSDEEILALVNGKYVRKDVLDLLNKVAQETHAEIKERLDKLERR